MDITEVFATKGFKNVTIREMNVDSWLKFKSRCVIENKTITQKIIELIDEYNAKKL